MRVAAYQAPLLEAGAAEAIDLIRKQVEECEAERIAILCCPEAILGGLADYADDPSASAIAADQLDSVLAPLASETVTTIVGFTERGDSGALHNSAAVFHRGSAIGIYRKRRPAVRRSVYEPGHDTPVFHVGGLTFGIVICYDSNFPELAGSMAARGAAALFVPTNNGLPPQKGGRELVAEARTVDVATAISNCMYVIRADVAGRAGELTSYGSSAIVNPDGAIIQAARELTEELLVAEIDRRMVV